MLESKQADTVSKERVKYNIVYELVCVFGTFLTDSMEYTFRMNPLRMLCSVKSNPFTSGPIGSSGSIYPPGCTYGPACGGTSGTKPDGCPYGGCCGGIGYPGFTNPTCGGLFSPCMCITPPGGNCGLLAVLGCWYGGG